MNPTRQEQRRNYFEEALRMVNSSNLHVHRHTGQLVGMGRRERRKLARAYAAKMWRERG